MKKEKLNSNKDNFKDWVGGGLRGRRKEGEWIHFERTNEQNDFDKQFTAVGQVLDLYQVSLHQHNHWNKIRQ